MDAIERLGKLAKAKYTSRKRGKGGKYVYTYAESQPSGRGGRPEPMTSETRTTPVAPLPGETPERAASRAKHGEGMRVAGAAAKVAVERAHAANTRTEAEGILHEHGYGAKEVKKLLAGKTFPFADWAGGSGQPSALDPFSPASIKIARSRLAADDRARGRKFAMKTNLMGSGKTVSRSAAAAGAGIRRATAKKFRMKSQQDDSLMKSPLPRAYLFDYLCAKIEEGYEKECREQAHKFVEARDLPKHMARAVMGELVQRMTWDDNLKRACVKYKCTVDSVAELLVKKGILKTRSDAQPTDSDSHAAMGAGMLAEKEVMAYSKPAPWMQKSDPNEDMVNLGVGRIVDRRPQNIAHTLRDDTADPHIAVRKAMETNRITLGRLPQQSDTALVTVANNCPVHVRDLSKAQNLFNAMTPCTCGVELNAYG